MMVLGLFVGVSGNRGELLAVITRVLVEASVDETAGETITVAVEIGCS